MLVVLQYVTRIKKAPVRSRGSRRSTFGDLMRIESGAALNGVRWPGVSGLLLVGHDYIVRFDAFRVRSLPGLRSAFSIGGDDRPRGVHYFAIFLADDFIGTVINLFQRGRIAVRIAFDRIVLAVKLRAPLIMGRLAFCVYPVIRKFISAWYCFDFSKVGALRRRTWIVL